MQEKDRKGYIYNYVYLLDGDELWVASYWNGFLCCYSLEEERIKVLEILPEGLGTEYLYSAVVKYQNKIIVVPSNAESILIYDKADKRFELIEIAEIKGLMDKFYNFKVHGDNLYMIGGAQPFILKLNMRTGEKVYRSEWKEKIKENPQRAYFQIAHYEKDNNMYLLSDAANSILIYDVDTDNYRVVEIGEKRDIYSTIEWIEGDTFLLTTEEGDCVLADIEQGKCSKIKNQLSGFVSHRFCSTQACFVDSVRYKDDVYLFPGQANMVVKYSIKNQSLEKVSWFDGEIDEATQLMSLFSLVTQRDGAWYGFEFEKCRFWKVNPEDGCVKYTTIGIEMLNAEAREEALRVQCVESIVRETKLGSLKEFIRVVEKL